MQDPNSKIVFRPWMVDGPLPTIQDRRVMILGESHYHDCENDQNCSGLNDAERHARHERLTIDVVGSWREKPHRSPISHRLPKLFGLEDKNTFWQSVIFYNYLQVFAGPKARIRPSEEMWADSQNAEAFQEVSDKLEPDCILVLGKKLWSKLPSQVPPLAYAPEPEYRLPVSGNVNSYHSVERICYWYRSKTGKRALSMPIMHPSAVGFDLTEWTEPVANWLGFSK